jgi:hypothetical protein
VKYCPRHKIALVGKARMCDECPLLPESRDVPAERSACAHDFQLEVVGDTLLTGHLVCRFCSHREEMSVEIHAQHGYPQQYQVHEQHDPADLSRAALQESQQEVVSEIKRSLTLVARTKKLLSDSDSRVAAWVRILPWGMGEAATALEFFVECLQ